MKKMTDDKPLFTLTAEEVETIQDLVVRKIRNLEDLEAVYSKINTEEAKLYRSRMAPYDNLLTRIKQWQDENGRKGE